MDLNKTSDEINKTPAGSYQILVFRSTIDNGHEVRLVCNELLKRESIEQVDVDLENRENILRVKCHPKINAEHIEDQVVQMGYKCSEFIDQN